MPFARFADTARVPYEHPSATDFGDVFVATGTPGDLVALGTTAANGAPVIDYVSNVTAGDATKGITLPALSTSGVPGGRVGEAFTVFNNSAAVLKVWPPTGARIGTAAIDAFNSLAANTTAIYTRLSATLFLRVG